MHLHIVLIVHVVDMYVHSVRFVHLYTSCEVYTMLNVFIFGSVTLLYCTLPYCTVSTPYLPQLNVPIYNYQQKDGKWMEYKKFLFFCSIYASKAFLLSNILTASTSAFFVKYNSRFSNSCIRSCTLYYCTRNTPSYFLIF